MANTKPSRRNFIKQLAGTAAAAVLLALIEGIMTAYIEPTSARIVSLVLMSMVLLLRPQGIFAKARA